VSSNKKKLYSVFARLFEEFKVSDQRCWLEIDRNKNGIAINFTHWHDSYDSNNKWIAIYENHPESFERLKNHMVEVMRGKALIKKGL